MGEAEKLTKAQLAAILGLSRRQIENLVAEGMPQEKVGRRCVYPLTAIAWYVRRKLERTASRDPAAADFDNVRSGIARRVRREVLSADEATETEALARCLETIGFGLARFAYDLRRAEIARARRGGRPRQGGSA